MKKKLASPIFYLKKALEIYFAKRNLIYFLKFVLLLLVLSIATSIFSYVFATASASGAIKQPIFVLPLLAALVPLVVVGVWLRAATYEAILRATDGRALIIKETLLASWKRAWLFFWVSLVKSLVIFLGILLLVIPGIIFGIWFSFALYIAVVKGTGVRESLAKSRALVKGRFWALTGRFLVFGLAFAVFQIAFSAVPYVGPVFLVFLGPFFLIPFYLVYKDLA